MQSRRRSFTRAFTKYNAFSPPEPYKGQPEARSWFIHTRHWLLAGGLCLLYCFTVDPWECRQSRTGNTNNGRVVINTPENELDEQQHTSILTAAEQDTYVHASYSDAALPERLGERLVQHVEPFESPCVTFPSYLREQKEPFCSSQGVENVQTTLIMTLSEAPDLAPRLQMLCQNVWKNDPLVVVLKTPQIPSSDLLQELQDLLLVSCTHLDILYVRKDPSNGNEVGHDMPNSEGHNGIDSHAQRGTSGVASPVAYLHNQALAVTQTSHVLILDEHVWPMPGLEERIRSAYTSVPYKDALVVPSVLTERTLLSVSDMSACVQEGYCRVPQGPESWPDNLQESSLSCYPSDHFAPYLVVPWCSLLRDTATIQYDYYGNHDDNDDDDKFHLRHRRQLSAAPTPLPFLWHDESLSDQAWRLAQADQWRYAGGRFWWASGFVTSSLEDEHTLDASSTSFHQLVLDRFRSGTPWAPVLSTCAEDLLHR